MTGMPPQPTFICINWLLIICINMSIKLRTLHAIHGIHRTGMKNIISLYVDDILFYISDPGSCVPNIVEVLSEFVLFYG